MIKRALLFLIVIGSIGWLTFIAIDILSDKSNYDETTLFGTQDGTLFIINRGNEVGSSSNLGLTNATMIPVVDALLQGDFQTAYVSQGRNHILINKRTNWDKSSLESLFNSFADDISIESGKISIGKLTGRYYKRTYTSMMGQTTIN